MKYAIRRKGERRRKKQRNRKEKKTKKQRRKSKQREREWQKRNRRRGTREVTTRRAGGAGGTREARREGKVKKTNCSRTVGVSGLSAAGGKRGSRGGMM
jgi:hypothetical protein